MPPDLRRSHFIAYFDGLRGFGALVVFLNHMGESRLLPLGAPAAIGFFTNGKFAVDVFFALSGYVMAMLVSRGGETLVAMSIRRYARLAFPAAASCVLSVALLATGLYYNRALSALNGSLWLDAWFGFPPSLPAALHEGMIGIFAVPTSAYNSSLWTLYYELWCSLALFVGAGLKRWWWLSLLAAAFAMDQLGANDLAAPACFAAGAGAFRLHAFVNQHPGIAPAGRSGRFTVAALATLAIAAAFYLGTYPRFPANETATLYAWFPAAVLDTWAPAAAGAIIITTIRWSPLFSWIFATRPMLVLGRLSFSIYLIHLPVICSLGCILGVILQPHVAGSSRLVTRSGIALIFVVVAAAVLLAAEVMNRMVDRPSIRFGRLLSETLDRRLIPLAKGTIRRGVTPNPPSSRLEDI